MLGLRRFSGPDEPAFRETLSRRPRPRAYWIVAYGVWLASLLMLILGAIMLPLFLSGFIKQLAPPPLEGPITITLLMVQMSPVYINLFYYFRIRRRVRNTSYLACPNCLFDLSGLTDPQRCPECAFDTRSLDIPAAWKSLFQ